MNIISRQRYQHLMLSLVALIIGSVAIAHIAYGATRASVAPLSPGDQMPTLNDVQCIDSDGGKFPKIFGTTSLVNQFTQQILASDNDVCVNKQTVREYFCDSLLGGDPQSYVFADITCGRGTSCVAGACVPTIIVPATGTLNIALTPNGNATPWSDRTVTVGSLKVPVLGFQLTAQNEPIRLTALTLRLVSSFLSANDVQNIGLYDAQNTLLATAGQMSCPANTNSCFVTWTSNNNILPAALQAGSISQLNVKIDVKPAGEARLGNDFKFYLNSVDISGVGVNTGKTVSVSGSAGAPGRSVIVPFDVSISPEFPAPGFNSVQTVTVGTNIARFKITNLGPAPISLTDLNFTDKGTHTGNNTTYKLYYSDNQSNNYTANSVNTANAIPVFTNLPFGEITIWGGSYRYVTVAINTIGATAPGDSFQLGVDKLGDVRYTVSETELGYDATLDGNINGYAVNLPPKDIGYAGVVTKQ